MCSWLRMSVMAESSTFYFVIVEVSLRGVPLGLDYFFPEGRFFSNRCFDSGGELEREETEDWE